MTQEFNCYIGLVAANKEDADKQFFELIGEDPCGLIHTEPSEDPEEGNTYVFSFFADVVDEDGDMDRLHDHFDLPDHPNLPYEAL